MQNDGRPRGPEGSSALVDELQEAVQPKLRYKLRRLWVCHLYFFGRSLQHTFQPGVAAVRTGQGPVLAWNNPLDIFGDQGQHPFLIAAGYCCNEMLYNLHIVPDAHRNSPSFIGVKFG